MAVNRTVEQILYDVPGPFMNKSMPPNKVPRGTCGHLAGVDLRYTGGLRKFYGMRKVLDVDDVTSGDTMATIDAYDGPSFFKRVTFQKRGTATIYHGFVIRWDKINSNSDQAVALVYTDDNGSTWKGLEIWGTGNSITDSVAMDVAVDGAYLFVSVDGKNTKTVYYGDSALSVVDMGPGDFATELGVVTESSTSVDSDYELKGNGVYQVRWRFYDSARGIYSAMSAPVTISLDHMKTTKAVGMVTFNSGGGDSGLLVDGDVITVNGKTYEVTDTDDLSHLLLHGDGLDGATSTIDSSASNHTISFGGNAQLDTAQKKFGTASFLFDGTTDYLSVPDSPDWDFGDGEFTVDAMVRFNNLPSDGNATIVSRWLATGNKRSWSFFVNDSSGTKTLKFGYTEDGENSTFITSDTVTINVDTWYHIAVVRDSDTLRFFLDGAAKGTGDLTGKTLYNTDARLLVGALSESGSSYFMNGWIDEVRIIKGDAYWTTGFTTPTVAYNDVAVNVSGLTTIAGCASALADAINGDAGAVVSASAEASAVLIEATTRGAVGNSYTLSVSETGSNTDDVDVNGSTLTGGGASTNEPEEHCKAVLDFPANDVVISGKGYSDFDALFDTVDVFRTINLGTGATAIEGSIFYLEQTIAKAGNWATSGAWDDLQVTIGTLVDESLPFQKRFNPETDVVKAPPDSGTIGRYQGLTFMGEAADIRGGLDTVYSSPEHVSGEYFTTFNSRKGDVEMGRPLRYMTVGDAMFILYPGGITHVYKSSNLRPLQFVDLHRERGLAGKEAVHRVGSSLVMLTETGVVLLNSSNGNMGQIAAANRVIMGDWKSYLTGVKSAYDSKYDTSFFLCPDLNEILMVGHGTQSVAMLEGANFVGADSGKDIDTGKFVQAFFITKEGLIVTPDYASAGSGSMFDFSSSYTLDGTVTSASSGGTAVTDSGATFHADMVGALCYMTSGANAGTSSEITAVNVGTKTLTVSFSHPIAVGDRYSVSPVVFKVRLWPLRDPDPRVTDDDFRRWVIQSVAVKVRKLSGFLDNDNDMWRLGIYRNGSDDLWQTRTLAYTSGGTHEVLVGDVLAGGTSGATAIVESLTLTSGTWAGGDAVGTLTLRSQSGAFQSETLNEGSNSNVCTVGGDSTATTSGTTELTVDANAADSSAALNMDGVDIEPYIEQIATGVSFELTNAEVYAKMTSSRNATA